jgi:hypothetical protein
VSLQFTHKTLTGAFLLEMDRFEQSAKQLLISLHVALESDCCLNAKLNHPRLEVGGFESRLKVG